MRRIVLKQIKGTDEREFVGIICCDICGKEQEVKCGGDNILWPHQWKSTGQLVGKSYDMCPECRRKNGTNTNGL